MTFCPAASNNWRMPSPNSRGLPANFKRNTNDGTSLRFFAAALALLALVPLAGAQSSGPSKLSWDYGVAPATGIICEPTTPKVVECIESFVIAEQTGKNKFKPAATLKASDICVKRTEKGGGWTCTAQLPEVKDKKKPVTWAVKAVTNTCLHSDYAALASSPTK